MANIGDTSFQETGNSPTVIENDDGSVTLRRTYEGLRDDAQAWMDTFARGDTDAEQIGMRVIKRGRKGGAQGKATVTIDYSGTLDDSDPSDDDQYLTVTESIMLDSILCPTDDSTDGVVHVEYYKGVVSASYTTRTKPSFPGRYKSRLATNFNPTLFRVTKTETVGQNVGNQIVGTPQKGTHYDDEQVTSGFTVVEESGNPFYRVDESHENILKPIPEP